MDGTRTGVNLSPQNGSVMIRIPMRFRFFGGKKNDAIHDFFLTPTLVYVKYTTMTEGDNWK